MLEFQFIKIQTSIKDTWEVNYGFRIIVMNKLLLRKRRSVLFTELNIFTNQNNIQEEVKKLAFVFVN